MHMGFFDKIVDAGGSKVLDSYGKEIANNFLKGIATVKSVKLENKKPVITVTLEGMPDWDITINVGILSINEDGTKIMLGDYSYDMAFIQKALNKYAVLTIDIDDPKIVTALKAIRKVL